MSANIGVTLVACGLVEYVGTAPTFTWQNGGFVNAIAETAGGVATITLNGQAEVDLLQACIQVSCLIGTIDENCNAIQTSDTVLVVRGSDMAAAAVDVDFWLAVYQRDLRG